ncbi:hypothetical protein [Streptomyces decoyicus]|uniref:hypothetical protein n=1 Tax=Streptomyces decoyicus TaxID=249567 RepID=UPI002E193A83|nr:hypothetical protein OG532_17465 [Streptomyces decoyicus]
MNAAQQHLLDSYRAARRGEAAPPAPGTHIVRTAREIQQWRRFYAVVTAPADRLPGRIRGVVRSVAAGLLRLPRRPLPPPHPTPPRAPAPTSAHAPTPTPTTRPDVTPQPAPTLRSDARP